jgi:hypothetical protein
MTEHVGFLCSSPVYEYGGFTFEVHSYCGPNPLRKDGELMVRIPKRFWDVWEQFRVLSKDEKDAAMVVWGGCQPIYRTVANDGG